MTGLFNSGGLTCSKTSTPWGVIIESLAVESEGLPTAPADKDMYAPRRFTRNPKTTPKISADLWDRIIALYHYYSFEQKARHSLEVAVALSLNEDTKEWDAHLFTQSVSSASVHGNREEVISLTTGKRSLYPPEGSVEGGTSHNHGAIPAFFSGTDDRSEISKPGIHIVVGGFHRKEEFAYTAVACLMWNQRRYYCPLEEIVDIPECHTPLGSCLDQFDVLTRGSSGLNSEEVDEIKALARKASGTLNYLRDISVSDCGRKYSRSFKYETQQTVQEELLEVVSRASQVKKFKELELEFLSDLDQIDWPEIGQKVSLLNGCGYQKGLGPEEVLREMYEDDQLDSLGIAELIIEEDIEVIRNFCLERGGEDCQKLKDDNGIDASIALSNNLHLLEAYEEWCTENEVDCPQVMTKLEEMGLMFVDADDADGDDYDITLEEEEDWGDDSSVEEEEEEESSINAVVSELEVAPVIRKLCSALAELKAKSHELPGNCSAAAVVQACMLQEGLVSVRESKDLYGEEFNTASLLVGEASF